MSMLTFSDLSFWLHKSLTDRQSWLIARDAIASKNYGNNYTFWVVTPDGVSNFIIKAAAPISACLTWNSWPSTIYSTLYRNIVTSIYKKYLCVTHCVNWYTMWNKLRRWYKMRSSAHYWHDLSLFLPPDGDQVLISSFRK